jgi:hypothetical protein
MEQMRMRDAGCECGTREVYLTNELNGTERNAMILKTKTRWSLGLLQMMGMGRRCARVCVTWDGKRDVLPWAFVLETDVGVVNLSGWMDGWVDKWVEQDLDRVVGDADWISGA